MLILRATVLLCLLSVAFAQISGQEPLQVSSPNGQIVFVLSGQAVLRYTVDFQGKRLIDESELGLDLQGQPPLGPRLALSEGAARQLGRNLYHPGW